MRQAFKNIFTYPLAAVTALLLAAGCDKQAADAPVTGFPEDGVVRVSTGGAATRADGESLYLGTNLGLFIDYGDGDRHTMRNVRWTKETSDWAPDTQMLWKDATTPAALYAYAPYVEGQTDPSQVKFYIPSDQTSGTTEADLVLWKNTSFVPNDNNEEFVDGKVLITFSHVLTKLTLNFEKASQFASDVTVEEVVLKNTRPFVRYNVKEGKFAGVGATSMDIKMHKSGDLQYEAVFYPGPGQWGGRKMLEVTMSDGTILFYNVPSGGLVADDLQTGKAYSMNMMLGKDKIEVIDAISVADWTDDDPFESSEAEIDGDVWDGSVATSFESGTGTETDPYIIATSAQLAYLGRTVNEGNSYSGKYLKLTSNILLKNKPWIPIGAYSMLFDRSVPFSGHFDGGGKGIYGLNINPTDDYYDTVGLFGYVANGASIKNCHVRGRVETTGRCAGGIVGELDEGTTITDCTAEVTVKARLYVGGLCGIAYNAVISRCHTVNSLVEGNESIGGIAGRLSGDGLGQIEDCTTEGFVKGKKNIGGICGTLSYPVMVSGCSAHVGISAEDNCGGFVGYVDTSETHEFKDCGFNGTITNIGSGTYFGAAVGYDNSLATFTGCWYNADKTGDLPVIGWMKDDTKDYSGIEAKHLGK